MSASVEQVWSDFLCHVAEEVPRRTYKNWFAPLHPTELEEQENGWLLCLEAPSRLTVEMVRDQHRTLVHCVLAEILGPRVRVNYSVQKPTNEHTSPEEAPSPLQEIRANRAQRPPAPHDTATAPAPHAGNADAGGNSSAPSARASTAAVAGNTRNGNASHAVAPPSVKPSRRTSASTASCKERLRDEYTFDYFIEGDCNSLARNAALAIAHEPASTSYNPFLVYGGVGLGKTHLAQAIGNYIYDHGSDQRVVYVSSEEFTSQFVRSIQNNSIRHFTMFYRHVDVLIVDDVQFFSSKEKTQEEFFHVFNALHQEGKQIVLCADRPPSQIDGIEERLLSRFQWGLSADVQQPDLETRIAILQRKAELHGLELSTDILHYVAHHVRESVRSLEGALKRLAAYHKIHGSNPDLALAKRRLHDMVDDRAVQLEVSDIMNVVADFYNVDVDLLADKTRKRPIVAARHVAMYFARELTNKSLSSIGLSFGGRDHSTVVHAIQTVNDRLDTEPEFQREIDALGRTIRLKSPMP